MDGVLFIGKAPRKGGVLGALGSGFGIAVVVGGRVGGVAVRRVAVRGVVWRRVMGLVVARLVGRLVVVLSLLRLQVGRGHGAHQHHHLQRIR